MAEEQVFIVPEHLSFCTHKYDIEAEIGEGTFSKVYKARCKITGNLVAIKAVTKTTAPNRICEELQVLKKLKGEHCCVKLLDVIRSQDQILMVFPFIPSTDFKEIILKSTVQDIKKYLFCLITAVAHMHRNNIIHRDLKPGNFLYDLESEWGCLIDFGLAHEEQNIEVASENKSKPMIFFNSIVKLSKPPGYYQDDTRPPMKAPRAGTRGFRAPEVLFKSVLQTKAIDMWSIGVIMLCILTTQYPFFISMTEIDGLVEIGILFGHAEMRRIAKYYGRVWKSNINAITEEGIMFETLIKNLNSNAVFDDNVYDLLKKLLDPIYTSRIDAEAALKHPFFTDI